LNEPFAAIADAAVHTTRSVPYAPAIENEGVKVGVPDRLDTMTFIHTPREYGLVKYPLFNVAAVAVEGGRTENQSVLCPAFFCPSIIRLGRRGMVTS
jgi:hypothetical protein